MVPHVLQEVIIDQILQLKHVLMNKGVKQIVLNIIGGVQDEVLIAQLHHMKSAVQKTNKF